MFKKDSAKVDTVSDRLPEFGYLSTGDIYMDSSCQALRPQPVIDTLKNYYEKNNACGGRVKYRWGQKVDRDVEATRDSVLDYLGVSSKDYVCSFTLNTTYGLNLILSQLPTGAYDQVITSEIEHNSVFLTTIELAKRLGVKRLVLDRDDDGALNYAQSNLVNSVVVVNAVSNIDGRTLTNIKKLISDTHKSGGIVIIDAAQAMAHYHELLIGCDADAICFSAHKMYAASLGAVVIKKQLLRSLNLSLVGGGMVAGVSKDSYDLLPDDIASWLEPGLQAYGEIISLKAAIEWLKTAKPFGQKPADRIAKLSKQLYDGLSEISGLELVNNGPSSVISAYSPKIDAHRLAVFLSASGVMIRSGYFCCHYYLLEKKHLPPLARFSIGLHTTEADVVKTIEAVKKIIRG